jgi:hypothetical protein
MRGGFQHVTVIGPNFAKSFELSGSEMDRIAGPQEQIRGHGLNESLYGI